MLRLGIFVTKQSEPPERRHPEMGKEMTGCMSIVGGEDAIDQDVSSLGAGGDPAVPYHHLDFLNLLKARGGEEEVSLRDILGLLHHQVMGGVLG